MNPRLQVYLISLGALGFLVFLGLLLLDTAVSSTPTTSTPPVSETASVAVPLQSTTTTESPRVHTPPKPPAAVAPVKTKATVATQNQETASAPSPTSTANEITRLQAPYAFPPSPFDIVNVKTRVGLVNILCMPNRGTLSPISGSGVIIDPKGIILTNAHVAQYVLLSQSRQVDLTCMIRTGSPAVPLWRAAVLYMPTVWVDAHFSEINQTNPMGTGEHDYALLSIISTMNGTPAIGPFPFVQPDSRNGIGFQNDEVLAAAYPAEFVGGLITQTGLYPASSVTSIRQLLTFGTGNVDAFSIRGVVEAQAGSSGGAVVNAWNRLIGIISITSAGATTAERDLRAITLRYIDTDIQQQTGRNLSQFLAQDPIEGAKEFSTNSAPALLQKYVDTLTN